MTSSQKEVFLVLLNIRSAENVGAIFRTADAAGVSKIYLIGYTPAPVDDFKRPNPKIAKAALGAEKTLPWETRKTIDPLLREIKKNNFQIIAIEQAENSVDYKKVKINHPVCFIVGNEVEGLPKSVLNKGDVVAEIPMKGKKESLNVSVATGIALFRLLNV